MHISSSDTNCTIELTAWQSKTPPVYIQYEDSRAEECEDIKVKVFSIIPNYTKIDLSKKGDVTMRALIIEEVASLDLYNLDDEGSLDPSYNNFNQSLVVTWGKGEKYWRVTRVVFNLMQANKCQTFGILKDDKIHLQENEQMDQLKLIDSPLYKDILSNFFEGKELDYLKASFDKLNESASQMPVFNQIEEDVKNKKAAHQEELKPILVKCTFKSYLNYKESCTQIIKDSYSNCKYKIFFITKKYADIDLTKQGGVEAKIVRVLVIQELVTETLSKEFIYSHDIILWKEEDSSWIVAEPISKLMNNYNCEYFGILRGDMEIYLPVNNVITPQLMQPELCLYGQTGKRLNDKVDQIKQESNSVDQEYPIIESHTVTQEMPKIKNSSSEGCCAIM